MEGVQYLDHRVIDGVYRAVLHWKVLGGAVFIKEGQSWKETSIPVEFIKDFPDPTAPYRGEEQMTDMEKIVLQEQIAQELYGTRPSL